jgi:hypothetical protein
VITYIDYVSDESGDWEGLYFNFQMIYQNHSIPNFIWLGALSQASGTNVLIREWRTAMDNETYTSYPIELTDLLLFDSQYQLTPINGADSCVLHKDSND